MSATEHFEKMDTPAVTCGSRAPELGAAPGSPVVQHDSALEEVKQLQHNLMLCARYALGIRLDEGHEYFEGLRQTTNDVLALAREHKQAMAILREIVAQYDAMPDGSLGAGLTNGPFLAAKDFLANTQAVGPEPTQPTE